MPCKVAIALALVVNKVAISLSVALNLVALPSAIIQGGK